MHMHSLRSFSAWIPLVSVLSFVVILGNIWTVFFTMKMTLQPQLINIPAHSYVGQDYPEQFPLFEDREVAMVAEESVHYSILDSEAREDWATNQPQGNGYVKLGPENRGFAVSMFHQLHCLRLMRAALGGEYDTYYMGHMQHCLNYLRQKILCNSDVTLEPADILDRDFVNNRVGGIHICRDWRVLYSDMESNWRTELI